MNLKREKNVWISNSCCFFVGLSLSVVWNAHTTPCADKKEKKYIVHTTADLNHIYADIYMQEPNKWKKKNKLARRASEIEIEYILSHIWEWAHEKRQPMKTTTNRL